MKKLMTLLILCCGFISAPLLSYDRCVTLLKKNQPTSCKAIGWYANLDNREDSDNREEIYTDSGARCFYECGRQEYTSTSRASSFGKQIVQTSARNNCNISEADVIKDKKDGQYTNGFGTSKRCDFSLNECYRSYNDYMICVYNDKLVVLDDFTDVKTQIINREGQKGLHKCPYPGRNQAGCSNK